MIHCNKIKLHHLTIDYLVIHPFKSRTAKAMNPLLPYLDPLTKILNPVYTYTKGRYHTVTVNFNFLSKIHSPLCG